MLDDNAIALSSDHIIEEGNIQVSSISKQINYQESIIIEREGAIQEANAIIVASESDIVLAKRTLSFLNGIDSIDDLSGKEIDYDAMILAAIGEKAQEKGIMIPEIKEYILETYKKSVSPTTIDNRVKDLVTKKEILHANPDAQRSKRYTVYKNHQNAENTELAA